ncbi:hypothetical protein G9A89_012944 [Geosiphon pyriformis]|nr:hypothetical protein G9A89_012944 [Geosiphon pyriformis]
MAFTTVEASGHSQVSNAFPDPSEDLFWQKAKSAVEDAHDPDNIWNPEKNQEPLNIKNYRLGKNKEKEEAITPPLPPPPSIMSSNNPSRHSRKSSRVNWNLQTESEKHVELLETKLKDVIASSTKLRSPTATDFDGTTLATLGYHPEESTTIATALSATISAENGDQDENNDEMDKCFIGGDGNIPQEYDEGLWLLWRNNIQSLSVSSSSEINRDRRMSFLLPLLTRNSNNNNNNNNQNQNQNQNDERIGEGDLGVLGEYYETEEMDAAQDEFLFDSARRKLEKEYLWGAGWWWWCAAAFTQRWIGCGICGLEEDEIIGIW